MRGDLATKGSDILSAATADLGAVQGLFHDITGTTPITSFGTVAAGVWKIIKFEGALTLTYNATSMILPGSASITTADGDIAIVVSEGSGNWRCVSYQRRSSGPTSIPPGTKMLFQQTAAPTGWTKDTTHDDKALRVVSGAASSGGATAFSSVFGSGKTTGSTVLTTSHLPASGLSVTGTVASLAVWQTSGTAGPSTQWTVTTTGPNLNDSSVAFPVASSSISGTTANMGSGNGHTHTESLDLHYVDVIVATKD